MSRKFNKKVLAVGLGGISLAVLGVVAAFAFFTANGTGSGTATVGSASSVSITSVAIPTTLFPGGSSKVTFVVTNPAANSQKVGNVVLNSVSTPVNCTAADFTFSPVTLSTELAAGAATPTETGTLSMTDATTNQDACQAAAPVLSLKVDNTTIGGH